MRAPSQRFRFFGGKGGVGKTTLSAACALDLARGGLRVLCVSTDPAHSLGDALGKPLSARPLRIRLPRIRGALFAAELDADRALSRWLAPRRRALRAIAQRGTYLDDEDIDALFDLSLPGVDELVGLVELERLSRGPYDAVVVDTAPTGHTLRLLAMPATLERLAEVLDGMQEKHRVLAAALASSRRPADFVEATIAGLREQAQGLQALLRDGKRCSFSWVLTAEPLALSEAQDGVRALGAAGIAVSELVVNRLTPPPGRPCPLCEARRDEQARVLRQARRLLPGASLRLVPALDDEPRGPAALLALARKKAASPAAPRARSPRRSRSAASGEGLLAGLAPPGVRLLFFGGKGGVGKTTCAAAAALSLAQKRTRLLLLSIDPAHSLGDALGVVLSDEAQPIRGLPPGLRARELDAARAFAAERDRYRSGVNELFDALRGSSRFDAALDRAVLRDLIDLAPPGLDELFALLALTDALLPSSGEPPFDRVVVDTAPTGHALRLLELQEKAVAWTHALLALLLKYRPVVGLGDLAARLTQTARQLRLLGELLRDPQRTRFITVTRGEELPRRETVRLLAALRRLSIESKVVLVNARTPPGCARCRRRAAREERELAALRRSKAARGCVMLSAPALAPAPRGPSALRRLSRSWTRIG